MNISNEVLKGLANHILDFEQYPGVGACDLPL